MKSISTKLKFLTDLAPGIRIETAGSPKENETSEVVVELQASCNIRGYISLRPKGLLLHLAEIIMEVEAQYTREGLPTEATDGDIYSYVEDGLSLVVKWDDLLDPDFFASGLDHDEFREIDEWIEKFRRHLHDYPKAHHGQGWCESQLRKMRSEIDELIGELEKNP